MNLEEKKQQVLNGDYNALKLYGELADLEKAIKKAKAEILEDAIIEFEKHGEKSVSANGFEISKSQSGRYDYSDNADWNKLQSNIKELEKKMQAAYKGGGEILDNDTGEIIEPATYKASKEGLKFKKL